MIVRCSRLSLRITLLLLLRCYYLSILIFLSSYQSQHWHKHMPSNLNWNVTARVWKSHRKCLEVSVWSKSYGWLDRSSEVTLRHRNRVWRCFTTSLIMAGPLGAVVCASLSKRSKTSCECLSKRAIDKLKMLNWLQLAIDSYCSLKTSMKLNNFVLELGVFLSLSQVHILSKTYRASYRMARILQMLTMWVLVLLLHIQNVKTDVRKPCAMIEDWFPSDVEPQSSKPPYVLDVIRQRNGKSVLEDLYQNKPRYDWHENYTSKMTFLTDNKFLSRDICTWVQI